MKVDENGRDFLIFVHSFNVYVQFSKFRRIEHFFADVDTTTWTL